jgi:MFS family permease
VSPPDTFSRVSRRRLGRQFGWLWRAYAVSAYGTWLGFGAFSLIAIRVLHAGPSQVSGLSAVGTAAGALVAVPLGPWMEFRRKRPVMIAMDLTRFAILLTIPVAYWLGWLSLAQMMIVSVVDAAADIAFQSASGAYLKQIVSKENLLTANGRMASTMWSSSVLGPPLGGAAIGLFGPTVTVLADAVSFLLSALGITAIVAVPERACERIDKHCARECGRRASARRWHSRASRAESPAGAGARPTGGGVRARLSDIAIGWRYILGHPALRLIFLNSVLVGGLILATEPLIAVLMLGRFGFAAWQYSLAFAVPCVGGFVGSRLSSPLAARFWRRRVMLVSGTLGACCPLGMALMRPGVAGLVIVMVVQLAVITSMGVFSPLSATYRLELAPGDVVARVVSAWTVSKNLMLSVLTALWGVLASLTGPLTAIVVAGVLLLATPVFLLRIRERALEAAPEPVFISKSKVSDL